MSNLHPIFQGILGAHGAVAYQKVENMKDEVSIAVPSIEVCIRPRGVMDSYHDEYVTLTEAQTQRAYDLLADYNSTELELIAEKLVKGELA